MSKHNTNTANKRYHDRVAAKYDNIYDDAYWEFHDRVTWNHLKPFLPKALTASVLDLGCGTGKWGFKLLKAGFPTTFVDLSTGMVTEVKEKLAVWAGTGDLAGKAAKATVVEADVVDLRMLPADHFELITAMGDVVSICSDPPQCLSEMHRLLQPGGVAVFTVDNHLAAIEHFIAAGNLEALGHFVKTGRTEWLTKNVNERFNVRMFTPSQIDSLVKARGFEIISRIGKTVIPARMNRKIFELEGAVERLVDLETRLQAEPSALACASHLQLAVRKAG